MPLGDTLLAIHLINSIHFLNQKRPQRSESEGGWSLCIRGAPILKYFFKFFCISFANTTREDIMKKKIYKIRYKSVGGYTLQNLDREVDGFLERGWELYGNPYCATVNIFTKEDGGYKDRLTESVEDGNRCDVLFIQPMLQKIYDFNE